MLFAVTVPALATNGVIEINQAKALAGGVTAGDTAGFPVTLSASGSYILTSDLDLATPGAAPNTHAVVVTGESVTLDLNGFAIFGLTQCGPPHPVVCGSPGTGNGIEVPNSYSMVSVRNGVIRNIGNYGIHQESGIGTYDSLLVKSCGNDGLHVQNATVNRVQTRFNGNRGIWVLESTVRDSLAYYNKNQGIVGAFAQLEGNLSSNNGTTGIEGTTCSARGNLLTFNQGTTLALSGCGWSGNTLRSCTGTCQTGSGNIQLGPNDCDGTLCP